ncbi:MAG: DDE-type integrase/transposase/recombinase [Anaerolineae bacterium]|nr:DDE-type integrase/transposase/recombinase [Anaerolineae bacterium]
MTRPKVCAGEEVVHYPHLQPSQPGQLCQVDIVPHYLSGGQAIACFNAIDVVSRYPAGQSFTRRRAQDAAKFLIYVWQIIGRSQYTQMDNEGCFSGGFTHPGVLGVVVRLALAVGTELVFSPFYHPESNGFVERFHQDYNQHVWAKTNLANQADVQNHADTFFNAYRHSPHHSALQGQCPAEVHLRSTQPKLAPDFQLAPDKLPLTAGRVHFIRQVAPNKTISVLNMTWPVLTAQPRRLGHAGFTDQRSDLACLRLRSRCINSTVLGRTSFLPQGACPTSPSRTTSHYGSRFVGRPCGGHSNTPWLRPELSLPRCSDDYSFVKVLSFCYDVLITDSYMLKPAVKYNQILCIKGIIEMTSQLPSIADVPIPETIPEDSHWWLWSQSTCRVDFERQVSA